MFNFGKRPFNSNFVRVVKVANIDRLQALQPSGPFNKIFNGVFQLIFIEDTYALKRTVSTICNLRIPGTIFKTSGCLQEIATFYVQNHDRPLVLILCIIIRDLFVEVYTSLLFKNCLAKFFWEICRENIKSGSRLQNALLRPVEWPQHIVHLSVMPGFCAEVCTGFGIIYTLTCTVDNY